MEVVEAWMSAERGETTVSVDVWDRDSEAWFQGQVGDCTTAKWVGERQYADGRGDTYQVRCARGLLIVDVARDEVRDVRGYGVDPVPIVRETADQLLELAEDPELWETTRLFGAHYTSAMRRDALDQLHRLGECEIDHSLGGGVAVGKFALRCRERNAVVFLSVMGKGIGNVEVASGMIEGLARLAPKGAARWVPAR
jgi:hypothetical protein